MCSRRVNHIPPTANPPMDIFADILQHLCHRTSQIENTALQIRQVIHRYDGCVTPIDKEAAELEWEALCDKIDETTEAYRNELCRVTSDILVGVLRAGGMNEREATEFAKRELARHEEHLSEVVWWNGEFRAPRALGIHIYPVLSGIDPLPTLYYEWGHLTELSIVDLRSVVGEMLGLPLLVTLCLRE
ncbi:hypothetical protein P154DRAFT_536560 [Amniculicola lignicola CBS 123094]|uniref:Uncharacterized protein n=1 Tax=Amniculicola lignicola CBS 123094 TaxID=1392246 RepID=A0A6A5WB53_9PLEO|nr:hypothetical protein P154DRAFT_536560 [Amniculicola lignicola CBS 123094]